MEEFTDKPPSCPKCGNTLTTRKYEAGFASSYSLGAGRQCLRCNCSDCGYDWEQKTKDADLVKAGIIYEGLTRTNDDK